MDQRTLALRLFEKHHLTLAQAAKLVAVSTEDFLAMAGSAGVVVVDYPPDELGEEMATALAGIGQLQSRPINRLEQRPEA